MELEELRSNVVGAQLGQDAIKTSLIAGAIGLAIVFVFMCVVYLLPGLASGLALLIYTGLVLVSLNAFDITLTLPGIAGIILGIGMAVDANVIIFARVGEELAAGKSVRSSLNAGFKKAMSAILDGNITTLIAAAVLWLRGSGTVKGFAPVSYTHLDVYKRQAFLFCTEHFFIEHYQYRERREDRFCKSILSGMQSDVLVFYRLFCAVLVLSLIHI